MSDECKRLCICKICRNGPCAIDQNCDIPYSIQRQCHVAEDIRYGIQKCNALSLDPNIDYNLLPNRDFYLSAKKKFNFTLLVKELKAKKIMDERLNQPDESEASKKSSSQSSHREGTRHGDRRNR